MTLSTFNRRLAKLNETGNRLMNIDTLGMTNSQRDTYDRKVQRNYNAVRTLCQNVSKDIYNQSDAAADLCCDWADWQE